MRMILVSIYNLIILTGVPINAVLLTFPVAPGGMPHGWLAFFLIFCLGATAFRMRWGQW